MHSPHVGELQLLDAKASIKDLSQRGTFSVAAEGIVKTLGETMALTSEIYGDSQQAKVDLQTQFNRKEYGMKMEATRSSLLIHANLVKHVVVNANVSHKGVLFTLKEGGKTESSIEFPG